MVRIFPYPRHMFILLSRPFVIIKLINGTCPKCTRVCIQEKEGKTIRPEREEYAHMCTFSYWRVCTHALEIRKLTTEKSQLIYTHQLIVTRIYTCIYGRKIY